MSRLPDIKPFEQKFQELSQQLEATNFFSDRHKATQISREHQKLSILLEKYRIYNKMLEDIRGNQLLLERPDTEVMLKELALEDNKVLEAKLEELSDDILRGMLPPNKNNGRNTIIEIRAGTGGNEASLFAADLFRMYSMYSEKMRWKIELMGSSPSECGGIKEISFLITGEEVFGRLKFESGVHRVQRVPVTEANGRIHTSAATVAILPEAEEVDVQIAPEDLEISVCRASGPGGQGVNTTDSAVQITHKPTGMIVTCADERSQQKNKAKALKVLRSRLLQQKEEAERQKYAENRRNQVGSGDRSERIRTYNFPQNRLTDHRIGLTLYSLSQIMDGDLDTLIDALIDDDYKKRIEDLLQNNSTDKTITRP
ncbi:MAG: peptide chain release factor 1 [Puniceicoccales bacterium]|jgi:peptide chain release factor 1|nr:peptide chain release factor 1 [Puniceicoccales bacterium]